MEFIKGMDVSMLLELEGYGAAYFYHGKQRDLFEILCESGVNLIRPPTKQGQQYFLRDLTRAVRDVPDNRGKGFIYWEPEWLPFPQCAWAKPAGCKYTNDKGVLGNSWANQALFDERGNANLPLAMPQIAVIFIFSFIATYSEYVISSVFLQTPDSYTLSIGLQSFIADQFNAHWTMFAAAAVLASVPVMVIFLLLQRYIQGGLVAGGVKG